MNVFLTGATGLLGINTTNALLAHGHRVLALARDPEKAARVLPKEERVSIISGDIENTDSWISRLAEADALIHGAAYFRESFGPGDHAAKLVRLNVELPVQLTQAADRAGVKKILMVSSSLVVPPDPRGVPSDESHAPQTPVPQSDYAQSKVRMEGALQEIAPPLKGILIIVRPGWMFGPNDYAPTSAGQLVRDLVQKGSVQLVGGTPLGIADARDVADGMVRALEQSESSTIYNLAGNPLRAIDALHEVAKQVGKATVQQIPMPVALALSALMEPFCRWRNIANPIPRIGLLTLSQGVTVSSAKAERELGVKFRSFTETARDTVAFVRAAL